MDKDTLIKSMNKKGNKKGIDTKNKRGEYEKQRVR